MMRVTAATLGPEQALIVCSLSGLTPELLDVVRLARNYDAPIVAITLADSPLAQLADVLLPLQPAETSFIYKPGELNALLKRLCCRCSPLIR